MADERKTVNGFLRDMSNMVEKAAEVQKAMYETIGRAMPEIASMVMASNGLIQTAQKIASTKVDLNALTKNLADWIEAAENKTSKSLLTLVEIGWPPNGRMTPREVAGIADVYKEQTQKIEQHFLKRFAKEEIGSMLSDWKRKQWLKKRIPILEEAVLAHFEGKYFISIPAMLAQIEGVFADGFQHKGKMGGEQLKNYSKKLQSREGKISSAIDSATIVFLLTYVWTQFEHGSNPYSFLSRHAILHGGDTNYGTAVNSLKCILLFDSLQERLSEIQNHLKIKTKAKNKRRN